MKLSVLKFVFFITKLVGLEIEETFKIWLFIDTYMSLEVRQEGVPSVFSMRLHILENVFMSAAPIGLQCSGLNSAEPS